MVEKYVSSYACKGNEPSGAVADLFNDIVNSVDENSDNTVTGKTICTKLLMGTVKGDISAVEASFELSSLPLYRCSHSFQNISSSGARVLPKNGTIATKHTPLDRYLDRPQNDKYSFYQYVCKNGNVPVISGGMLRATWPLTEEYCKNGLLLHWPNWRTLSDIKDDQTN